MCAPSTGGRPGAAPLSPATRDRLLQRLLALANRDNVPAMEALIRLSCEFGQPAPGPAADLPPDFDAAAWAFLSEQLELVVADIKAMASAVAPT